MLNPAAIRLYFESVIGLFAIGQSAPSPPAPLGPEITVSTGVAVALTGMSIVFMGLVGISLFVAVLPRLLEWVGHVFPEREHGHRTPAASEPRVPDQDDELQRVAAIGVALIHHGKR